MGFDFVLVVFVFGSGIDYDPAPGLSITAIVGNEHGSDDQVEPELSIV